METSVWKGFAGVISVSYPKSFSKKLKVFGLLITIRILYGQTANIFDFACIDAVD